MLKNIDNVKSVKVEKMPKQYYSAYKVAGRKHAPWKKLVGMVLGLVFVTTSYAVLASGFSVGYTVALDDTVIGTVAAKGEYYAVLDEVKTEMKDIADLEFEPLGEESFQVEIVRKSDLTDKDMLAENLKATQEGMVEAASILVGETFFAAVEQEYEAHNVIEKYLSGYVSGKENITAEFAEGFTISVEYVPAETVKTPEEVYEDLLAGKSVSHIAAEGETLEHIAAMYHTTPAAIKETNELKEEDIAQGMTLIIYTGEPLFDMKTVEHIAGEFDIPFETVQEKASDLYQGRTEIKTNGVVGARYKEAYITRINGELVEENVLRDELLREPVAQVERVGTKVPPPSVGTGDFAMPASGRFSSPFGRRWGRSHTGIDIAAKTGTPIYASDNGKVTESQYKNNGYGNFISIDHGNGFVTYYAHCSELLVKAGDVVAKGDLIARVGNTGRSTGAHLHFEVRLDGKALNPMQYIK